jgi:hypothetical protein
VKKYFHPEGFLMEDEKQLRLDDLRSRIDSGEPGLLSEYEQLLKEIAEDAPDPIFERLCVKKRKYTLSPAAIEQRRRAGQTSPGPSTPEGKAASRMNAWKHGLHARTRILNLGKPCKSTCPQYPCVLVDDGATRPGQQCLDKEYMLSCVEAVSRAVSSGDLCDLKDVVSLQIGQSLQVIDELQNSILEHGVYMKDEKMDKHGKVIGYALKPNPSLLALANLLKAVGVTMPDFMITPAALEKKKTDDTAAATIADIFRNAGNALAQAKKQSPTE